MTAATPDRPVDRYGTDRAPGRRRALVAVLVGLGVLAVGAMIWIAWGVATPPVRAGLVSYELGPDAVTATIEVVRDPDVAVTCVVRAAGEGLVEVGRVAAPVPTGGAQSQVLVVTVRTVAPARAVTLGGCEPTS